jgi:hypothetical protein
MTNTVCFNKPTFFLMVSILVIATAIFMHFNKDDNMSFMTCPPCENNKRNTVEKTEIIIQNKKQPTDNPFVEMDKKSLEDPLIAPERRLPAYLYPRYPLSTKINIPTRGYPPYYQFMGNLYRKTDEKFVQLFGRQTHPGSNKYEYYGITTDRNSFKTKIKIETDRDKELYDGDEVTIDMFDPAKGKFKLELNELGTPKYNPYVI